MVVRLKQKKEGKRKMKVLVGAVVAAAALAMTGCVYVPGTIGDKTKPMDQNGYAVVGDEVSATELQVYLFSIPLSDSSGKGSAGRRMYKDALAQAQGADALIEYTTDYRCMNLGIVNLQWYTLTGVPVKTKK